ncbi:MAG: thiamine pyrophosphate-binding protein [Gemmataceae bacterium]
MPLSRRELLQSVAFQAVATPLVMARLKQGADTAWVEGKMSGAEALVETLLREGTEWVFGIPGAQNNELWDTMKTRGLGYVLVTHEFSASTMADGYARATGKPGVLCVVPGPGLTNSLSGIGEALLDSIPLVAIVTDVARGKKYKPFQVHELPEIEIMKPLMKGVFVPQSAAEIPMAVRQAFDCAKSGEPGPAAVVISYPLFIEKHHYNDGPLEPCGEPFDFDAFDHALGLLANPKTRVGIYAGLGCMDYSCQLVQVAEMLQAPVATSVSGKGVIPEDHPLAVGWGYGPQGTVTAETVFKKDVDLVLAIGVRFSEVSTGFYSIPDKKPMIQVDINPHNLCAVATKALCVNADAGMFLLQLQGHADILQRPHNGKLQAHIASLKAKELAANHKIYGKHAVDAMAFVLALRKAMCPDALLYVDVTTTEHFAAEAFTVYQPRTYFNPTDNQSMGWSIPASIGGQRAFPGRQVATITGDGCFLMSAMEISTAAREHLPVKFFVMADSAYYIMQRLQKAAFKRTTATFLAPIDYAGMAHGLGVAYNEICVNENLEAGIQTALCHPGPVLTRVITDYDDRPIRWIEATKDQFIDELSAAQKIHFLARLGARGVRVKKTKSEND